MYGKNKNANSRGESASSLRCVYGVISVHKLFGVQKCTALANFFFDENVNSGVRTAPPWVSLYNKYLNIHNRFLGYI